jgi:F-box/leucine-rich repeat protein 13
MVCRSWREVAQDPTLWGHLKFSDLGKRYARIYAGADWCLSTHDPLPYFSATCSATCNSAKDRAVESIVGRFRPYIAHVNMRNCSAMTNAALKAIGQVYGCGYQNSPVPPLPPRVSNAPLLLCRRQCRNLQDLNLSDCNLVRDTGVKCVAEGCKSLIYLNLTCCSISDLSMKYIARNLRNLSFLRYALGATKVKCIRLSRIQI